MSNGSNLSKCLWLARELAAGLALLAIIVAPVGCLNVNPGGGDDDGDDLSKAAGLFIGEDVNGAIIAARNEAGDAFFVFGERNGDEIQRVDSILHVDADGRESSVLFESGRPVQVQGPDGDSATISYSDVTPTSLTADVLVRNAAGDVTEAFTFDLDLEQTAREIARLVEEATGRDLTVVELDEGGMTTKNLKHQVRITIFSPLYGLVLGLGTVIASMIIVLGQIVAAMVEVLTVVTQALVLAIFSPFFAIAALLGDAVVNIRLIPLDAIFVLPRPPVVIVT